MSPKISPSAALLVGLMSFGAGSLGHAQEPMSPETGEVAAPAPVEPPPTWRFKLADRPVKVVVLAGSIGAWPKQPYAERLQKLCKHVEVKNLSKVGFGAGQLRQRFRQQVLDRLPQLKQPGQEHWLVFQGGLNSVGTPERTNHDIREMFVLAHARGFKVVGLSLTPWGDESDKRWVGAGGLRYLRATTRVVDFVLGALSPREALGDYARQRRAGADAGWEPEERADVAVDLYRSALRATEAPLREHEALARALERDRAWKAAHAELAPDAQVAALAVEAAAAAQIPRWFLREELRSFDHIHPNAEGHRLIAEATCPKLPASWGCECPTLPTPNSAPPRPPAADQPPAPNLLLLLYPPWLRALLGWPVAPPAEP
jgi:lysophospholipase L1-like esterase